MGSLLAFMDAAGVGVNERVFNYGRETYLHAFGNATRLWIGRLSGRLTSLGLDIEAKDENGSTLLSEAARQGMLVSVVWAMIESGADRVKGSGAMRTTGASMGMVVIAMCAMAGALAQAPARQPGETFSDALNSGGEGPEMVVIPAGRFRMGCVSGQGCYSDERPVHEVTIPEAFAVSVYEVTFAQWDACVLGGGCGGYRPRDRGWGRGTRPVMDVSWDDAQGYVGWLSGQTGQSYRLLSESEWEYVARAGSSTAYSWGNAIGSNRANCGDSERFGTCGDQWENTAPVGSFQANAYGVHDMHGNVWEWVEDCWNESYGGAPSDGSAWLRGDCERRVLRGGSWSYDPGYLRSAYRYGYPTGGRDYDGFRVARTLTP